MGAWVSEKASNDFSMTKPNLYEPGCEVTVFEPSKSTSLGATQPETQQKVRSGQGK